jgi:hypothetical protein
MEWCTFYYRFDGREYRNDAERDGCERELFEIYGEAPMVALIVPRHKPLTRDWCSEFFDWLGAQPPGGDERVR